MNGEVNQNLNTDSPDLLLKALIMKSNQQQPHPHLSNQFSQQQYEQHLNSLKNLQLASHNEKLETQQQNSTVNQLCSIPLPPLSQLPFVSALQNFQATQMLNLQQQQLFQQQNMQNSQLLKSQQVQHQLIEERLLQQSKIPQQNNVNQDYLIESNLKNFSPPNQSLQDSQSIPLYSNAQNYQQDQLQTKNNNLNEDSKILTSFNYMPGTASLIEYIDKQLMVILRDGKKLIGYLRSIDQYANLLLSSTFERIYVNNKYADIQRGVYIVRGENVVLLGEIDLNAPLKVNLEEVSEKEILELQSKEQKKEEESEKTKRKALLERCLISNTDTMLDEYY